MTDLSGRKAIVTGASKGLGREIVRALAHEGVSIALVARPSAELDTIAEELGRDATACPCDIRFPDQIRVSVARAAEALGAIDFLINNAGLLMPQRVESLTDDDMQTGFATNLFAPFWMCREAIPHLRARGGGHIINVTSETVRDPHPLAGVYAASKAGVEMLSMSLKHELRPDHIRVTTLRVGKMDTGTIQDKWTPAVKDAFLGAAAASGHLARSGTPLEPTTAARAVVDILSLPADASCDLMELRGR